METPPGLIGRQWKSQLATLCREATQELVIVSPYISIEGARFVRSVVTQPLSLRPRVKILTDLSPSAVAQGATDPSAVLFLGKIFSVCEVSHLSPLHAKVYIADTKRAIVTSGNLTGGGLDRNYEYGVEIGDDLSVVSIRNDVLDYADIGAHFDLQALQVYAARAREVRGAFTKAQREITRSARRRLQGFVRDIGHDLLRRQLAGGRVHAVFSRTILYLLRRFGQMETEVIHYHVQRLHPELCDDSVDRVIDDERYGKKWKHQVRTAQSGLKRKGWIELYQGKWRLAKT